MNKPRYAFADTMQNTSLCFALRASLRLSKFDPVEFLEQKANAALERVNNLTHKMPGAFCTANAPAGAMPGMASSESILAKAMGSRVPALGAAPQPAAAQIRSCRICKGELTAHWRAANPDLISGENSAEALLNKIIQEREATATNKKAKKNA